MNKNRASQNSRLGNLQVSLKEVHKETVLTAGLTIPQQNMSTQIVHGISEAQEGFSEVMITQFFPMLVSIPFSLLGLQIAPYEIS